MEHLLFLTGRLAEPSLRRVLEGLSAGGDLPFTWEVHELGLQVAALMTADLIRRRLPRPVRADRVLVPGRCRGDLVAPSAELGLPVERGPEELKDLPRHFRRAAQPVDLSEVRVCIFAEIVDAPRLTVAQILARAAELQADGADVIDLGCLPDTPFPHLAESVMALKAAGFAVSVDSLAADELLTGGRAGVDYLLSLPPALLWIADEVAATPVLIGSTPDDEEGLAASIETLQRRGRPFLADAILDPIPFGLTRSIVRYQRLRDRFPDAPIMMGTGNLTELTEADTSGIHALLLGIAAELDVAALLTTQVSAHARRAVAEADHARRVMQAARRMQALPKGLSDRLMTVHDKHPWPDSDDEIATQAAAVRDPNFRIHVNTTGLHVYNRDGLRRDTDPFRLWPQLGLEDDAGHAFYMGVELARAEIAWQLGKRYVQDQPLDWGIAAVPRPPEDLAAWCAPAPTRSKQRRQAPSLQATPPTEPTPAQPVQETSMTHHTNDVIYEAVVTTVSPSGALHVAPMGVRYRGDEVVVMPFKPSTTLENILANGEAVLNLLTDTRVFAGCVTGRRDWPTQACSTVRVPRLNAALRHLELKLRAVEDDAMRPTLTFQVLGDHSHAPFLGMNRAQAAVIEGAVLVSRLRLLPLERIEREMAALQIAIDKTASDAEREAWGWLQDAVAAHRQRQEPRTAA